jgi:hypothetical protein
VGGPAGSALQETREHLKYSGGDQRIKSAPAVIARHGEYYPSPFGRQEIT